MALNNLPSSLQNVIQTGMLEREFHDALYAKLGFRDIAEKEAFPANVGESITKTRTGLLPAIITPLAAAANTDLSSGLTPQQYATEQYILTVNQYAAQQMLNVVTSRVAIADIFLRNAATLAEQARRSVDTLACNSLFNSYFGGNTRVTTTLGAAGTAIKVDDIRGFQSVMSANGQLLPISSSNTLLVTIGPDAATKAGTADAYTVIGAVADTINVSTSPGGISGTLTTSSNVTIADGTAGNTVLASNAPVIIRPDGSTNVSKMATTSLVTIEALLSAKTQLEANNVPELTSTGMYRSYLTPQHLNGLYADPVFQSFLRGRNDSEEYKRGVVTDMVGMEIVKTNISPVQSINGGVVKNAIVVGQGSLIEGDFTGNAYGRALDTDDDMITVVNGVAHITREPLDALKQVVTQSWAYIGGFVVPSDTTTNTSTIPSASNSAFKRAVIVQSF